MISRRGLTGWLFWAVTFFVLAIIAGILGFGVIAGVTYEIAKWLTIIFVILFIVSLIVHMVDGRR